MKNVIKNETQIPAASDAGKKRPSLKVNAVSNWAALGVNIVVGFWLTPFVLEHLGKTGYGLWSLIGTFVGYYGVLNLGVGSAVSRYIARYLGQKNQEGLSETASTAMSMFCGTGGVAVLLSFVLARPLANFFDIEPDYANSFVWAIYLLGVSTGLTFPCSVYGSIINAMERYVALNVINILSTGLRVVLTVIFLKRGNGLLGVAWATFISTLFIIVSHYLLYLYYGKGISIRLGAAKFAVLKAMIVYGGFSTVINVADIMRYQLNSFVIGKMISVEAIAAYSVVSSLLIRYMNRFVFSGVTVLDPRFARLDGVGAKDEIQRLFLRSLWYSAVLTFGMGLLSMVFGGRFIHFWVGAKLGPEYVSSIHVLWILTIGFLVELSQSPGVSLMFAMNKHYAYAFATIAEAIANLTMSLLLAKRYGIVGVAMGTLIPMLIVKSIQPVYVARLVGIPVRTYLGSLAGPAMVGAGIFIIAWLCGMVKNFENYTIKGSLACVGLILAGYSLGVYVLLPAGRGRKAKI